jgi:hypothetical protein
MERFVEILPYGAVPIIQVRKPDLCYVLDANGGVTEAKGVDLKLPNVSRRRVYVTMHMRGPNPMEAEVERAFVVRAERISPVMFDDPNYEVTLHVIRSADDLGRAYALVVSPLHQPLPGEPLMGRPDHKSVWSLVLGDFLG